MSDDPTPDRAHVTADRRPLLLALLGSVLTYLAHPPVGWSLLAWIGPAAWFAFASPPRLPGRRPYRLLWLAGTIYWLLAIQWVRLPHWANIIGLFFIAGYLGAYLPLCIALTRTAVHRLRIPMWLAAPVAWTGLEWIRARLLTGFLMASLAHTQVRNRSLIQIADVFGEYGVTFLVILVAASIASVLPVKWLGEDEPRRSGRLFMALKLLPALALLIAAWIYGEARIADLIIQEKGRTPHGAPEATVALIQSDMLADWKGTPERDRSVMQQMTQLSRDAVDDVKRPIGSLAAKQPVDLIVWPETMFRATLHMSKGGYRPPKELFEGDVEVTFAATTDYLATLARSFNSALMVGIDRVYWSEPADDAEPLVPGVPAFGEESFKSAACVDRTGKLVGTYDKMHLLPFGEYTPLADWIPFLRSMSPITGLASPGAAPAAVKVDGVTYVPNICYETVLPQLIRFQIADLIERGEHPDVMVNLTNDAWYWGSSELDMHLASDVFRAIEMRLPLLVAANRGLSAHIDRRGRVVAATERDIPAHLVTTVQLPPNRGKLYPSVFAAYGDWFALACLLCCTVPAMIALKDRRRPQLE